MDPSIGIVTLNAKYIHSSLSIRYLRNAARDGGFRKVWIREYTINDPIWKIAADIIRQKPDVVGLSVYIWNRRQTLELVERLRKQRPSLSIVLGGPEVSFDMPESNDYTVIAGEGEAKWTELLDYIRRGEKPSPAVKSRWRVFGEDLPGLIAPYTEEDIPGLKNRIVYFETSRGCPYLCSFCLSALDKTVRYFDDTLVFRQIEQLIKGGVRKIKFVDRTFNIKTGRMMELMRWLAQFRDASFHFEVVGDILTPEIMGFLESVPEGLFQFEIGIQTTEEESQQRIQRRQDNEKLFQSIRKLVSENRIHIHCDLIFGLPGETLDDMLRSFSRICSLEPHELQLGFLKFLPGAPIRKDIEPCGYQFQSHPPYEMISNRDISADEIIYLKKFAEVFDLFYNSKRFRFTMQRLIRAGKPVKVFHHLLEYMESRQLLYKAHSLEEQYRIVFEAFCLNSDPSAVDLLKFDFLYAQRAYHLPRFLHPPQKTNPKFKTWKGDRRTPVIPFGHEIHLNGRDITLIPSQRPEYYAVVHPKGHNGYLQAPSIQKVSFSDIK